MRASPLARSLFVVYALLVVYASLYPLSGWRDQGLSAFAYLTASPPRYVTAFDVVANLLGYLPYGFLCVLALYPRLRGFYVLAAAAPAPAPARTFLVFFDWDKANLTSRAKQIVGEAAKASQTTHVTKLNVNGYTDTSGAAGYNMKLSLRRANNVAAELVADGVPKSDIVIKGFGETHLRVPTGPNVLEPQNRRVAILLHCPFRSHAPGQPPLSPGFFLPASSVARPAARLRSRSGSPRPRGRSSAGMPAPSQITTSNSCRSAAT